MTPAERLQVLWRLVDSTEEIRAQNAGDCFLARARTLNEPAVDSSVVGGAAAVLEGAPIATFDRDVVHPPKIDNIERLLTVLAVLDAHYRLQPERRIRLAASHLLSSGHPLWMTRYGPLDVLGRIGQAHDYEDLVEHVDPMEAGPGLSIKVLRLSKRIEVKSERAFAEDLARLPILRRPLEEKSRR